MACEADARISFEMRPSRTSGYATDNKPSATSVACKADARISFGTPPLRASSCVADGKPAVASMVRKAGVREWCSKGDPGIGLVRHRRRRWSVVRSIAGGPRGRRSKGDLGAGLMCHRCHHWSTILAQLELRESGVPKEIWVLTSRGTGAVAGLSSAGEESRKWEDSLNKRYPHIVYEEYSAGSRNDKCVTDSLTNGDCDMIEVRQEIY
ncbi:hypothetical protein C4D60_Mb02t13010 [Musa balbisiana]|uniref:Uncharacterized protein n=1 Tax=Musa balbisiana TaxID=52838 RepID=A0A4S8IBN3_MUSBA|nr:hypothetical protein C4D60_Mb02t13010 [Musa balbisiana]